MRSQRGLGRREVVSSKAQLLLHCTERTYHLKFQSWAFAENKQRWSGGRGRGAGRVESLEIS